MTPKHIVIHCSDSRYGTPELLDIWHRMGGFDKLGYHYVITNGLLATSTEKPSHHYNGKIWPGRDEDMKGAHCLTHNASSIGICLIGKTAFTDYQMDALRHLVQSLLYRYDMAVNDVYGHYELDSSKTCPNFNTVWFRQVLGGGRVSESIHVGSGDDQ